MPITPAPDTPPSNMPYLDVDPSGLFNTSVDSSLEEFEQISLPELIIQQDSHVSEEEEAILLLKHKIRFIKIWAILGVKGNIRRQVLHLKWAHQA